jgi:hypothetical protein
MHTRWTDQPAVEMTARAWTRRQLTVDSVDCSCRLVQNALLLYSHSGVNSLLTAQAGKLTLKQLQTAVVAQQQMVRQQEAQVQTITQGIKEDGADGGASKSHPFDHTRVSDVDDTFPGENHQMREMIFQRSITLYEQHERSLQINPTKHRIGHVLMTEQQRYGQSPHHTPRMLVRRSSVRATDYKSRVHDVC